VDRLIERVAGLHVHKASVKACVRVPAQRPGERQSQTRTFRTTTAGLVLLGDWRASHEVTVVGGMESTGVVARGWHGHATFDTTVELWNWTAHCPQ
jgi:transposase